MKFAWLYLATWKPADVRSSCDVHAGMTMLVLKREQWTFIAEALKDIANLAVGAMVFGSYVSDRPFDVRTFLGGLALWILLVLGAVAIKGAR